MTPSAGKMIYIHIFRTGRVRRYGHYKDLRAASCAKGLLEEYGWNVSKIKYNKFAKNPYYIYAEVVNHRPDLVHVKEITGHVDRLPRRKYG